MTKYEPPESAPCPVVLYEGDEGDDEEIDPESVVRCGEDSPRKLSILAGAFGMPTGARRGG